VQKDDVISEVDDALVIGEPLSVVQELLSGPLRAEVELALLRLDKKTSSKQRFSAVVLFDHKPRPVDKAEYGLQNDSSRGEPGIVYSDDAMGLKVKGFVTGSSAASSGLQIGDVIVEVEDELLMGLSSALAFEKMTGDRNTEVAVTAMRKNPKTGGKERVSAYVLRDVGSVRKVERPEPESGVGNILAKREHSDDKKRTPVFADPGSFKHSLDLFVCGLLCGCLFRVHTKCTMHGGVLLI
jgi:hypothetical protein